MIEPKKPVEDMTPDELKEFRNSLSCDDLGPENLEGVDIDA